MICYVFGPAMQRPRPSALLLATTPLNVLALFFGSGMVLRYLGVMGLGMGLLQYFAMKHVRGIGSKII